MSEVIITIPKNKEEEIREICKRIRKKDKNFMYEIEKRKFGSFLIIYEQTRDKAWKKCCWFLNKVKCLKGVSFKVK